MPKGDEEKEPVKSVRAEQDLACVPVYEAFKYHLTFCPEGGTCDVEQIEVCYDKKLGTLPIPERLGYRFCGWYDEADLLTEDTVMKIPHDVSLTALWEPISYEICFDGNGATEGAMDAMTCTYDEAVALCRNQFVRQGYVFMGWSLDKDAVSTQNSITARERRYNGAQWLNEDEVSNLTAEDKGVVTLYAVWQELVPGVMEYRYCMGQYQYFACVTTHYETDRCSDEGALFVAMTPSGGCGYSFGEQAIWSASRLRQNLNDDAYNDFLGIKLTDTTVNYSYSGMMYGYDPNGVSPCTRADMGFAGKLTPKMDGAAVVTWDYMFVPDVRDCYRYYKGNDWNWFWDMNLDMVEDVYPIQGVTNNNIVGSIYYPCVNNIAAEWGRLGWNMRYWTRNYYTGYTSYPVYIAPYGIGPCNPEHSEYQAYRNCCSYLYGVRTMYTRPR